MYKRPHHQKIAHILHSMNADFLREARCYFGGGTTISLLLGEYRESASINFLCADQNGYRKLRESIFNYGLDGLFTEKIAVLRDVRTDRDKIHAFLLVDNTPIKFEIVREARIALDGENQDAQSIPVPCLSKVDLFVEKLLSNADRHSDKSVASRDIIDLMVMEQNWGAIPAQAWAKAEQAYGQTVRHSLANARKMLLDDPQYLADCLKKLGITENIGIEPKPITPKASRP